MPCKFNGGCNHPAETEFNCNCPEKICIQVSRVFDACISQLPQETAVLEVTFPSPVTAFISASNMGAGIISDVIITPLPGNVCSRIQYTVTVPLQVVATDAAGATVLGTSSITLTRDILLRVPKEAMIPTEVQSTAIIKGVSGTIAETELTMTYCATLITKIVAEVDVLIQTFGYAALPNCQEFAEDVCAGVLNLPVYPR